MLVLETLKTWKDTPVTIYPPTYVHESALIGENTKIGAFCDIGKDVEIGPGCNIQCHVNIPNGVKVGRGVFLGPGVRIANDKYVNGMVQPPQIGDYTRIGLAAKILPNLKIGPNAFIAAGTLITKDVEAGQQVKGKW